jgi:hypothetical protein
MTTQAPSIAELIEEYIAASLGRVHTVIPAEVLTYDATSQKANLQPSVKGRRINSDGDLEVYKLPVIPNVPVLFLSSGNHAITFPLSKGDTGFILCSERSIDEWKTTGNSVSTPNDPRRFSLADATFLPAGRPFPKALSSTDPSRLVIDGDISLGSNAAVHSVALAELVSQQLTTLKSLFNGWVPVPNDGGAALKTVLESGLAGWPGNIASSKVKAE